MSTLKRYILNSVTIYPTTVDVEEIEIADSERMLDGTFRKWHRAFKNRWVLAWTNIPESLISTIRALYRNTNSMTLNNENNENFTVVSTGFTSNIDASNISLNGIMYYNLELTLEEV